MFEKDILSAKSPEWAFTINKERDMNKKLLVASAVLAAATMSFGLTTWNGAASEYRVITDADDGSDESGYWFSYSDENNSGTSSITWPVPTGNEYDDSALDPIIDECGGLCGSVSLGAGYDYPFAGIGFNLAGPAQTGVDVTSWGGVCINYTASGIAPVLELGPEDEATFTEYNNYMAKLKITTGGAENLAWSAFKQESGWGVTVDQATYLTKVAAIKIKFAGKAGTTGSFNIQQIGETGKCDANPISAPVAASSVKAMLSGRTLSFSGINSAATAEVINLQGQVVAKSAVSAASAMNLASLDAGVYMVRVSGKAVNFSQKIVLK